MSDAHTVPIVVVGESHLVEGFVLGGARVIPADRPEEVRRAWEQLPEEAICILTPNAAEVVSALADPGGPSRRLSVVMPG